MDLTPYLESLRRDLAASAAPAGEAAAHSADLLSTALESAARLCLLEALSDAAAEITQQLSPGSVEVRLHGREPQFVVETSATPPAPPAPPPPPDQEEGGDDGGVARLTLRLPEALKARAEDAAARRGQSLNTWLTQVIRLATRELVADDSGLDISAFPMGFPPPPGHRPGRRITGWAR